MRRVIIFSYTEAGRKLNSRVVDYLEKKGDVVISYCYGKTSAVMLSGSNGGMVRNDRNIMSTNEALRQEWRRTDAFVFIGAIGIAVRHVASFLESKVYDPAVLVLDEKGQFVIPVVSGHIGGGVALTRELAELTGGQAVITTATDLEERFAVDVFARRNHLWIEKPERIKVVSSALLQGRTVDVWTSFPVEGEVPKGLRVMSTEKGNIERTLAQKNARKILTMHESVNAKAEVQPVITIGLSTQEKEAVCRYYDPAQMCVLKPRQYILGIGCKKGKTAEELEAFLKQICERENIDRNEIGAIASIDVKKEEPGIWELSRRLRASFEVFSAGELERVEEAVTVSDFVKETVGVDNVCERSAYCLARLRTCTDSLMEGRKQAGGYSVPMEGRKQAGGYSVPMEDRRQAEDYRLLLGKQARDGMTMAIVEVTPRLVW